MRIEAGAQLRISDPSPRLLAWANTRLRVKNPDYEKKERMGLWLGGTPKELKLFSTNGKELVLPIGASRELYSGFPELRDVPTKAVFAPVQRVRLEGGVNMYPYQENAVNALLGARRGILIAPCGAGKTNIGLEAIRRAGMRALWLTHTSKLLKQSEERARSLFPKGEYGEITEGEVRMGRDITFATVQTLSKVDPSVWKDAFSVLVVDECHHCVGSPSRAMMFYRVCSLCAARYKWGLTATLKRADGLERCATALLGEACHEIAKSEVGARTLLAEHRKVSVPFERDALEYSSFDGTLDFNKLLACLCSDARRDDLIRAEVERRKAEGSKGQLVLTARVSHAKRLAEILGGSCLVGSVPEKKRDYSAPVLVATYALAKEGLDIPRLDAVHLATPTRDAITVTQSVGRCERVSEGKLSPVCYDYADEGIPYCVHAFQARKRALKKRG